MKIKKPMIMILLIVIIVIIWTINIRFMSSMKIQKATMKPIPNTPMFSTDSIGKVDYDFKRVERDPFNVIVDTEPQEPLMPLFSLKGIVLMENGALALMELPDGNVYPLKKGEKYLGVKIKKITPKQVVVEFRGKRETFTVWQ